MPTFRVGSGTMETAVEETAKHTVKLTIEVPPEEFGRELEGAYRTVAQHVKIPGFRRGKAPRQIIDARVGRAHVMEEFVRSALPTYYLQAIRENDLAPIGDPDIELDQLDDGKALRFTATVEVRPRLHLAPEQYKGVRVEEPSVEPAEREVEEYVDSLRERFAELDVVSRPARKGDYVLADVRAYQHDTEIPEATRAGYLYEVGSEELVPELDRELEGKRRGEILRFNAKLSETFAELAGQETTFQVLVREVKAKRLPAADDEFAKTASEFDTMEELRQDVRSKLVTLKEEQAKAELREQVLWKVVDAVDVELPERLVDEETQRRVEGVRERAEAAGTDLAAVLATRGWDELRFRSDARAHAVRALKADLVLEAVARQEGITVSREDLDREVEALAESSGRDPREVWRIVERSGQVRTLAGDIIRSKALDLLVESAEPTSEAAPDARSSPEAFETQGERDE